MAGQLFAVDDPSQWRAILSSYRRVLEAKAEKSKKKELVVLDEWYQNNFAEDMQKRKPVYVSKDELVKVMKWKLMRGKFRPRLSELVASNSEEDVLVVSKKAFSQVNNSKIAIKEMTALKGVGPATASALLSAAFPGKYPFMADEAVLAIQKGNIQYNITTYLAFQETLKDISNSLNKRDDVKDWTPHKIELCLWTKELADKLKVDIYSAPKEKQSLKRGAEEHANEESDKRPRTEDSKS